MASLLMHSSALWSPAFVVLESPAVPLHACPQHLRGASHDEPGGCAALGKREAPHAGYASVVLLASCGLLAASRSFPRSRSSGSAAVALRSSRNVQVLRQFVPRERQLDASRWLQAARGTPLLDDDPDGELMRTVTDLWEGLEPSIMYLHRPERIPVLSALCVAALAHKGQKRKSGEPFLIHPVAVAELLASMQVPADVVCAGLLHDTVEDCEEIQFADIEVLFGHDVRKIVEGETKASKRTKLGGRGLFGNAYDPLYRLVFSNGPANQPDEEQVSKAQEQAENLREMFFAMADDYRVIIVKLADRLHNMRTLEHMPDKKKMAIAAETLAIFAPLAHRLGVWMFKSELEDLSFKYLHPEEYTNLNEMLKMRHVQYQLTLSSAERDLQEMLDQDQRFQEHDVRLQITGREKGTYSLWYKMQKRPEKYQHLDDVQDIVALRVVLDMEKRPNESDEEYDARGDELCYHALSLAHSLPKWGPPDGGRAFKDYIKLPKPNGYRSLHTTIVHDDIPVPFELQIRTKRMHDVAEYGMAAHWAYKGEQHGERADRQVSWLSSAMSKGDSEADAMKFVEDILHEALGKRCYVFLRDGRILNLSRGCTPLDAAFKIHTEVGTHMEYAMVNDARVDMSYLLQNGDRVNIITSKESLPKEEWLDHAFLRSTRTKLATHFKWKTRDQEHREGMRINSIAGAVTAATVGPVVVATANQIIAATSGLPLT